MIVTSKYPQTTLVVMSCLHYPQTQSASWVETITNETPMVLLWIEYLNRIQHSIAIRTTNYVYLICIIRATMVHARFIHRRNLCPRVRKWVEVLHVWYGTRATVSTNRIKLPAKGLETKVASR